MHTLKAYLDLEALMPDGAKAKVDDLLIDGDSRTVHSALISLAKGFEANKSFLEVSRFGKVDVTNGTLETDATKDEVERNAGHVPQTVAEAYAEAVSNRFGDSGARRDRGRESLGLQPEALAAAAEDVSTRLFSVKAIIGSEVETEDGLSGKVEDLVADPDSWELHYVVVFNGAWKKRPRVLVPVDWVESVDWVGSRVVLAVSRAKLEDAQVWKPESYGPEKDAT